MNNRVGKTLKRLCYNLRTIFLSAGNSVSMMMHSPLAYVMFLFVISFWYLFIWNIKEFAAIKESGVAPFLLPHFFSSDTFQVYGKLLLVLVTCNVPFLSENSLFSIPRIGRVKWCVGQMLYIALANILFMGLMFLTQIVTLIPYLDFSKGWGETLTAIADNTSVLIGYHGYGTVCPEIVFYMSPLEATVKQFLLCTLLGMVIGAMSFLINGLTRQGIAPIFMIGGVLLTDYMGILDDFASNIVERIPFNWLNLDEYIDKTYNFDANIACLFAAFMALALLCCLCVRIRWIRTTD